MQITDQAAARSLGLLEQKGNATCYVPTQKMLFPGHAPHTDSLSENLRELIQKVGKQAPHEKVKQVIKQLCSSRPFRSSEIALILQRSQRHVRDRYLTPMVESGELELGFRNNPAHFHQSYQTKKS